MIQSVHSIKVSSKLYIAAFEVLWEQLMHLFNLSIKLDLVPSAWKQGIITPISKKGDRTVLNNIRPITLTHMCGKMLEKLVACRLNEFCESNNLSSKTVQPRVLSLNLSAISTKL